MIKVNLLSKLRISIITELEIQLLGKDYKNELLILSLIYFRTAFFKGWVPMFLSPAGPRDNLKRDAPGTSLRGLPGYLLGGHSAALGPALRVIRLMSLYD